MLCCSYFLPGSACGKGTVDECLMTVAESINLAHEKTKSVKTGNNLMKSLQAAFSYNSVFHNFVCALVLYMSCHSHYYYFYDKVRLLMPFSILLTSSTLIMCMRSIEHDGNWVWNVYRYHGDLLSSLLVLQHAKCVVLSMLHHSWEVRRNPLFTATFHWLRSLSKWWLLASTKPSLTVCWKEWGYSLLFSWVLVKYLVM